MTGFGLGEAGLGAGRITIELRSVNHRYSDVRVRVPSELMDYAVLIEQLGRKTLSRGRFDVSVRVSGDVLSTPSIALDKARALYAALCRLRDELNPKSDISIGDLLAAPGLFSNNDPALDADLRQAIEIAFTNAVKDLENMRLCEGKSLSAQLAGHVQHARSLIDACHERAQQAAPVFRAKLQDRLNRLLVDARRQIDDSRLEQEVALLAERSDVTEEISRLVSHFDQFTQLLDSADQVGRRLDFLLQEVARESNTIGAKSQDSELSHLVVELKSEVEKMREQVQNVE
jgi:uncharacterized protein (TIGR00255 family)